MGKSVHIQIGRRSPDAIPSCGLRPLLFGVSDNLPVIARQPTTDAAAAAAAADTGFIVSRL